MQTFGNVVRATARKFESTHDKKIPPTSALAFFLLVSNAVLATVSFTHLPNQPPDNIVDIVNDPASNDIYAAASQTVIRSVDQGVTWQKTGNTGSGVWEFQTPFFKNPQCSRWRTSGQTRVCPPPVGSKLSIFLKSPDISRLFITLSVHLRVLGPNNLPQPWQKSSPDSRLTPPQTDPAAPPARAVATGRTVPDG